MDAGDSSSASSSSLSPPASPSPSPSRHHRLPPKFRETRHPVYRGVRTRGGGTRWVCEVREPQAQARIWLGTYPTPEMAARAHDVAAIALRGAAADDLNFPDSAHALPTMRRRAGRRALPPIFDIVVVCLLLDQQSRRRTDDDGRLLLPCCCFLDEDAIFDMPGLIDDMARGMLLTPPATTMGRGGLDDEDYWHCTLWMDMD